MNKKLIALAVAAAAAAPAALAHEVVLYGQANVAAVVSNTGANKNSVSIDSQSSRIGFKGDENLGSGLSAWFQVETEIGLEDADKSSFANREGWVGVKSNQWGGIALGRGKSAFTRAYEEFDPFYQDAASASMGFGLQGYTGGNALVPNKGDGEYAYRTDNTVRYNYTVEGMDIAIDYATMENKATNKNEGRNISAYVKSTIGNFWILSGLNSARNHIAGKGKLDNSFLGAGTSFGDVAVSAAWQSHNFSLDGYGANKRNTLVLAASTTLGDASLYGNVHMADKLKYGKTKLAGSNFTKFGVGLAVPLSKRTNIVTELVGVDFGGSAKSENSFSTGIYHAF